jgi:hypothetical protein
MHVGMRCLLSQSWTRVPVQGPVLQELKDILNINMHFIGFKQVQSDCYWPAAYHRVLYCMPGLERGSARA